MVSCNLDARVGVSSYGRSRTAPSVSSFWHFGIGSVCSLSLAKGLALFEGECPQLASKKVFPAHLPLGDTDFAGFDACFLNCDLCFRPKGPVDSGLSADFVC